MERKKIIDELSNVDVKEFIEKKGKLDYVSWANAWSLLINYYPDSTFKVKEYPEYLPDKNGKWYATGRNVDYRLTPFGCEVSVTVYIGDQEFSMSLYVMDNRNQTVKYNALNYGQIYKTQLRALVKAIAIAGLGLNVYAGEDLPTDKVMENKGIKKQQKVRTNQIELGKAKSEYQDLLSKVVAETKMEVTDVQDKTTKAVKGQYPEAEKMQPVKKYEAMNNVLREMLKESGKESEELTFEEVQ